MIDLLALAVVVLSGLYLAGLGVGAFVAPARVSQFLLGFASSPAAHYLEMALRIVVGGALVLRAPDMLFPGAFAALGWILLLTTGGLLLVPWRWHRQFTQRSVPGALRYLPLLGTASLLFGGFVLFAAVGNTV